MVPIWASACAGSTDQLSFMVRISVMAFAIGSKYGVSYFACALISSREKSITLSAAAMMVSTSVWLCSAPMLRMGAIWSSIPLAIPSSASGFWNACATHDSVFGSHERSCTDLMCLMSAPSPSSGFITPNWSACSLIMRSNSPRLGSGMVRSPSPRPTVPDHMSLLLRVAEIVTSSPPSPPMGTDAFICASGDRR